MKLKKGQRSWKMWAVISDRGSIIDFTRTKAQAKGLYPLALIKKVIIIEDE